MEASNNLKNVSFGNQNETVEMVVLPIFLELFNIMVLTTGACLMYLGIEISHPIYGLLFSNLIVTIASSLINVLVFPFVKTINYNSLVNGNSSCCLIFHCSCWCVLSALRYLYIIHKPWIDKTFPKPFTLFLISISGVVIVFSFACVTTTIFVIQLGWPTVKLMNMPWESKLKVVSIVLSNYAMLLGISCCFYVMILRKRGQFGQNRVHLENMSVDMNCVEQVTLDQRNSNNVVDTTADSNIFATARDKNEIAIIYSNKSEEMDIELKRQMAEINSAVKSLKTNFILTSVLSVSFALGSVISPSTGSLVFTFLKGLFPVLTTISNFNKVQDLVKLSYENLVELLSKKKKNIKCCC